MTLDEWVEAIGCAALKVAPLAGSEAFVRVGDRYRADPEFIAANIEKMRSDLHSARLEIARIKKEGT